MVSWQTTVSIAFEIANDKGAQFDGIQDGAEFMTQLSEYWGQNEARLKQLTESQARSDLRDVIEA